MKKHPFLKAMADYCFDKLAHLVISVAVGLAVVVYQNHETPKQVWGSVGPNLMDSHNEIYANLDAINSVSNRLVVMERRK